MKIKEFGLLLGILAITGAAQATSDSRLPMSLPIRSFSTGWTHTLHIRADGTTWAVGNGANGQLGSSGSSSVDEKLVAMPAGKKCAQVSAGGNYSLCIATDGSLWSWGRNDHGQRGLGNTIASSTPTQVGTDTHWRSVFGNYYISVGIKDDGTLWGWGDNCCGQFGPGGGNVLSPAQIGTGNSWIAAFGGSGVIVALKADGTIWGIGRDESGQFGRGTATAAGFSTLTQMATALPGAIWRSVSLGADHVLAIRDDGNLYAWGVNSSGKLGIGSTASSVSTPTLVSTAPSTGSWKSVSAGGQHSLGLKVDGTAWGWGSNTLGQLGIGNTIDKNVPTAVQAGAFVQLYAGQNMSSGILQNGTINHWGDNSFVRCGFPPSFAHIDTPSSSAPPPPPALPWRNANRERILATGTFSGFTTNGWGDAKSWGANNSGQLGDQTGVFTNSGTPAAAGAIESGPISVAPGEKHTLFVSSFGVARGFGSNDLGELGNNMPGPDAQIFSVEVAVSGPWLKVAAHYEQSFGLSGNGLLYGWGDDSDGQLGINDSSGLAVHLPTAVSSANRWAAIAPAIHSTYAIASDGSLWAWGNNTSGGKDISPVRVGSANNWIAIAAGAAFAAGLTADGKLWTWGSDGSGALGNGSAGDAVAPVNISVGTRFVSLTAGGFHALAATVGAIWGWGDNNFGQLGLNHVSSGGVEQAPVQTLFPRGPSMATGEYFSIALDFEGAGKSAGSNAFGQLGIGSIGPDVYNPTAVLW